MIIKLLFFYIVTASVILCTLRATSEEYYVDFDNGNDRNSGKSFAEAWKHAPDDPRVTLQAADVVLQPGDTVLFKAGVIYRGQLNLKWDGAPSAPITYKSEGGSPDRAILDGSDSLPAQWILCTTSSDCYDNPYWNRIYTQPAPLRFTAFNTVYQNDRMTFVSQNPNPIDPFYYDRVESYIVIPKGDPFIRMKRFTLADPRYLNQKNHLFWKGSFLIGWTVPNLIATKEITSFFPPEHLIYYNDLGNDLYENQESLYSLLNNPSLIDRPGEISYMPETQKLYYWPYDNPDINEQTFTYSARRIGININGRSNIVIEGFHIRNYYAGFESNMQGVGILQNNYSGVSKNIVIRNNLITNLRSMPRAAALHILNVENCLIENNVITDNQGNIGILCTGKNINVRNNYVRKNSRLGIWFMNAVQSQIFNNTVEDIRGSHSNGISIYSDSRDVLVANNRVLRTDIPITFRDSGNLTFLNNVVIGNGSGQNLYEWANSNGTIAILNNVFLNSEKARSLFVGEGGADAYIIKNNIIDGGTLSGNHSHNIFTGIDADRFNHPAWSKGENETIVNDLNQLFENISDGDLRPTKENSGLGAGEDVTNYLPLPVFPNLKVEMIRPQHSGPSGWDIGPVVVNGERNCWLPLRQDMDDYSAGELTKGLGGFHLEKSLSIPGNTEVIVQPDGGHVLKTNAVNDAGPTIPIALIYDDLPLVAGNRYEFRISMRADRSGYVSVGLSHEDNNSVFVCNEWLVYKFRLTATETTHNGRLSIGHAKGEVGNIWIQEPSLTVLYYGPTPTPTPISTPTQRPPTPTPLSENAVIITDTPETLEDLSNGVDLDEPRNFNITLRWNFLFSDLSDIHVYVRADPNGDYQYLGRTHNGLAKYFEWKQETPELALTFVSGPQPGHTYEFMVFPLTTGGEPPFHGPFVPAGPVTFQQGEPATPTPTFTATPSPSNTPTRTRTPTFTPTRTATRTPTPSITPTITPTATATPLPSATPTPMEGNITAPPVLVVSDDEVRFEDLSGGLDTDTADNRALFLHWYWPKTGIADYHIYMRENETGEYTYLGRTSSGGIQSFTWKQNSSNTAPVYAEGPQFGHRYEFWLFAITEAGEPVFYGPYANKAVVRFEQE